MTGHHDRRLHGAVLSAVLLVPILMSAPTKAYGYTDPGTGTYAYQVIYASLIAGSFYFRKIVTRFFGKGSGK